MWAGQYAGRSGSPSIILEAIADYGLWIWHAYFGLLGNNNEINVLESSHLFSDLAQGISLKAHYIIQGKEYHMGYYLVVGIYPKWATIVETIHKPHGLKKNYFAMRQEACRKAMECAFRVLQSRFAITAGPTRFWRTCNILHNMMLEYERNLGAPIQEANEAPTADVEMAIDDNIRFQEFVARHAQSKDKQAHTAFRNASIDHLWDKFTNSDELVEFKCICSFYLWK